MGEMGCEYAPPGRRKQNTKYLLFVNNGGYDSVNRITYRHPMIFQSTVCGEAARRIKGYKGFDPFFVI